MNQLESLDKFQDLLAHYEVSNAGKQILQKTKLVLCSGPTASGRSTIIRELLKTGKYHFIISDTTRKPRDNDGRQERNGVEYWFRTEEQMLADLEAGKLIEAEIVHAQQVSGMSVREVEQAQIHHQTAITDVDRGGVRAVLKAKPDAICLFFLPPSFKEWQRRIDSRGHMLPVERERRLNTAVQELENSLEQPYYTFVTNDNYLHTAVTVDEIVTDPGNINPVEQVKCRELAAELLAKTKELLKK